MGVLECPVSQRVPITGRVATRRGLNVIQIIGWTSLFFPKHLASHARYESEKKISALHLTRNSWYIFDV